MIYFVMMQKKNLFYENIIRCNKIFFFFKSLFFTLDIYYLHLLNLMHIHVNTMINATTPTMIRTTAQSFFCCLQK